MSPKLTETTVYAKSGSLSGRKDYQHSFPRGTVTISGRVRRTFSKEAACIDKRQFIKPCSSVRIRLAGYIGRNSIGGAETYRGRCSPGCRGGRDGVGARILGGRRKKYSIEVRWQMGTVSNFARRFFGRRRRRLSVLRTAKLWEF